MLKKIKKPQLLCLSAIFLFNAYLRVWNLPHLFLWINDYDEGAYSIGGRLISQGFTPYKDFTLVHPPLYDLVLASIYKVFGYNFFYGRYFSILLSFVCLMLVYFIIKKLYNSTAGLVAALLFVVFPGFYASWYRAVQEPLAITFILLSVYFASDYIKSKEKGSRLIFSGVFLGLALATKYTFVPAVLAFVIAVAIISTDWNWKDIRTYFMGLLKRDFWLMIAGIAAGYFLITGYFIIKTPQAFLNQTILTQLGYRVGNTADSILNRIRGLTYGLHDIIHFSRGSFEYAIATMCVIFGVMAVIALLFKRNRSKPDIFFLTTTLICLPLCSLFSTFGRIRFFASFYLFILLALVTFVPMLDTSKVNEQMTLRSLRTYGGTITIGLLILIFIAGTIILRLDYNFLNSFNLTYEELSYKDTIKYLKDVGAKKIYTFDPVISALAPELNSVHDFDTFGNLITMHRNPSVYYQELMNEGIDYAVIDPFSLLSLTSSGVNLQEFIDDIRQNGTLVMTVAPNDLQVLGTEIFKVTRP